MIRTKQIRRIIREVSGYKRGFKPSQWSIKEIMCTDGVSRLAAVYNPTNEATFNSEIVVSVTAYGILKARSNHTDMNLSQMYDEVTMPGDLITAHQLNDRAVMEAYGFDIDATESEIVSELFKMYNYLAEAKKNEENLNGRNDP